MSERILVALSGGVDSAVAAMLLKQQGHDIAGVYLRTWMNEPGEAILEDCPWEDDIRFAEGVAHKLGIDFEVVDFVKAYRERVVDYLIEGYRRGITPNPDVMCNREMKFGVLRDYAKANGFAKIATGHYCRRIDKPNGRVGIAEGLDPNKDQSYFLAMVTQEQLQDALFPIGDYQKPQVRDMARDANLPNANRKDSQGICFLGKVDINAFLAQYIPDKPGDIVRAQDGVLLGTHKGLHRFTLGQRKGIGVPSNTDNKNYVVVGKDLESNQLLVAFDEPDAPGLHNLSFRVEGIQFNDSLSESVIQLQARPRYRDPASPAQLILSDSTSGTLEFADEQRALASGQLVAFYQKECLLGGAFYL